jgi:methionine aminopeptidase
MEIRLIPLLLGQLSDDVAELLRVTHDSLYKGIEQAVAGKRLGDIGHAVQTHAESSVFRLCGRWLVTDWVRAFMRSLKFPIMAGVGEVLF